MIAFHRYRGHEFDGLYVVDDDGANLNRLDAGGLWMGDAAWPPDGASLVAVGRSSDPADPADFVGQLNLVSLDGTRRRITEDGRDQASPDMVADR